MPIKPLQSQSATERAIQFIPAWHQQLIDSLNQRESGSSAIAYYVVKAGETVEPYAAWTGISVRADGQNRYRSAIKNSLDNVASKTGLSFVEVGESSKSQLDFYYFGQSLIPTSGGADGVAVHFENDEGKWASVFWNDIANEAGSESYRDTLLLHELGHVFGLSHPENKGDNPDFNTADTVMSYLPEWWEPGAYLPSSYNSAEGNVLDGYFADAITGLPSDPLDLNIDKSSASARILPNRTAMPGQSRSEMHDYSEYRKLAKDPDWHGRDRIRLSGGGTYQALSGKGRDNYIVTKSFVDNVTGVAILSDFDPARDKFKLSRSAQKDSDLLDDVRLGSIGSMPALFNEDNLVAVFGLFDSNTPIPFSANSGGGEGLRGYSHMLQDSIGKLLA